VVVLPYADKVHDAILVTAAASWYLVGLSVTVGLVTYPAFSLVGDGQWPSYHRHHSARISWAVGVAWVAQAVGLLWWFGAAKHPSTQWFLCGTATAAAVVITGLFAVGLHNRLGRERAPSALRSLNRVHTVRTVLWIVAALAVTAAL